MHGHDAAPGQPTSASRALPYPDPDARPRASAESWDGPQHLTITVGTGENALAFTARLEVERAPQTCRALLAMLPLRDKLLQTRWSGEAAWVPLGSHEIDVPYENHTVYPLPGHLLLFRGGISQPEILLAYGVTAFSSKVGPLAGNHVATITTNIDQLAVIGQLVLWEGAQDILIELA